MFGFNFGMGNVETVVLDIYQGTALVQQQQISMPTEMLQAQFLQLIQQAAQLHSKQPMRVKMWQIQDHDGKNIEVSIEFRNWFEDGE